MQQGKISKVSQYGFQINNVDEWHNYDKYKVKPEQKAEQSDVGTMVAFEKNDKGYVISLGAVKGEVPKGEEGYKTPAIPANNSSSVNTKHDAKTLDIHRQVAVKTAFEYAGNFGKAEEGEKYAFELAKRIEDYLNE